MKKQRIRLPNRQGLVAEYLLNGNTKDTSGNGYDGTPLNVTYSKTDRGYQTYKGDFNGSSSKVDLPTIAGFSSFSIIAVFKTTNPSLTQHIVRIAPTSDNANIDFYIESGQLKTNTYNGSGVNQIVQSGTLTANTTYFACVTNNAGTGTLTVRSSNGETVATGTLHNITFGTNYCSIGYGRQWNANFTNGSIQSVRIFNRAISADEIRDWYLEGLRALGGSSLSGLMDGVVAYYDFRGDANDIISGYDGTVNGATLTTDRFGTANNAYSFNGTTDNIYLGNGNLLSNGSISVSTWVKFNSLSNNSYILSRGGLSVDWSFMISFETSDGLVFYTHTAPTDNRLKFNVIPSTGQWYHITSVFDSDGFMRAYVNGTLAASRTCGTSLRTSGTIGWTLGNSNSPSGYAMNGSMDECKIFYSALSDEKVKALYELSKQSKLLPFA